jgi:SAM-dependent methyltransferase
LAGVILDVHATYGDLSQPCGYEVGLHKEEVSRHYVFETAAPAGRQRFLDVGASDGSLRYLLGVRRGVDTDGLLYEVNRRRFDARYDYFGLDLNAQGANVISDDICAPDFGTRNASHRESFDVVYSNNVFEHLEAPWLAVENLYGLMKPGGLCITIVPFSQRYHEVPTDYFRYTHTAIPALFRRVGPIDVLVSGYDVNQRRVNWQGMGRHNDACPVDDFGAWRETWFSVCVLRKS